MPGTRRLMHSAVPLILLVVLFYLWKGACERRRSVPETSSHGTTLNPIAEMLRPSAAVERQEGIAVAILVDSSGSMADKVRDAEGELRPKIEIARRAVSDLMRMVDQFAREHTDRRILAGIYEFSVRDRQSSCRRLVGLSPPNLPSAETALRRMEAKGGTPIGNAMIAAKLDLDATGFTRRHILVVTDGENTHGYSPGDVASVISTQTAGDRASIYFVAFDIQAERFNAVRDAGGLVLAASNAAELKQTLDYLLTGKILVEQPAAGSAK